MRYMIIVSGSENLAEFGPPSPELVEAIEKNIEELTKKGKLISYGGLFPTAMGVRLRITKGKLITTDGPFTESKEVIGGFSVLDVASKDEALEEARKSMELNRKYWPKWEGQVEIRQLFEAQDDVRETQIEGSRQLEQAGKGPGHEAR